MLSANAITIPIYKAEPDENEIISLSQALLIFKDHDIILVCPENLNIDKYKSVAKKYDRSIGVEYFDTSYFASINGYNNLMLSTDFYERFSEYTFILIYQLDCFAFRDELNQWVQKGYDYIGAPWLHNDRRTWWTLRNRVIYNLKAMYRRYTNKPISISMGYYKVGNGGFSLRNVQKCCNIIRKFEANGRINIFRESDNYLYAEDVFWGCEVNRYVTNIKIPSYKEALGFSFDMNPSLSYELNGYQLPFGCHAWNRYEPDFWKPFIQERGFSFQQ